MDFDDLHAHGSSFGTAAIIVFDKSVSGMYACVSASVCLCLCACNGLYIYCVLPSLSS